MPSGNMQFLGPERLAERRMSWGLERTVLLEVLKVSSMSVIECPCVSFPWHPMK